MRVLLFPIVAIGALAVTSSDEPGEAAMRSAFARALAERVQSALDFVAETGGPEALEKVRAARTDAFEVLAFRKLDCARTAAAGHVCAFTVRIGVGGGVLERTLSGQFIPGSSGLLFRDVWPIPADA
jgi:hypothetical protein